MPTSILTRLALAIAFAATIAPPALACGPVTQTRTIARPRTATGSLAVYAKSTGIEHGYGIDWLTLSYPKFSSGEFLYMDRFTVVADANLRRLERTVEKRIADGRGTYAAVEVEQIAGSDRWRVVSWHMDRQ